MVILPGLTLVTPATAEPIPLWLALDHLRLEEDSHDVGWVMSHGIPAARKSAERFTGLALARESWLLTTDAFADTVLFPRPPLVSVQSVKYDDADSVEQTLATSVYGIDTTRRPATLTLKANQSWPSTNGRAGSVRISFTVGYLPTAAAVSPDHSLVIPHDLVEGMLLLLGHIYKNREATANRDIATMPLAVDWFLRPHRILTGFA